MPAVPALIMAGSAVYGAYQARRASQEAQQRSPEELAAMTSSQRLAGLTAGQGQQVFNTAMPAVQRTLGYYGTLLNGTRAARNAAVAPETQSVANAYEGANRAIGRGYVRGGARDYALAENARGRAADVARLTTGVRPQAAQAMSSIAGGLLPQATANYQTAAGINEGLVGTGFANRRFGQEAGNMAGQNWGQLFARLMSVYGNRNRGGGVGGGNGTYYEPNDTNGFG
jgi:hypothetical protein